MMATAVFLSIALLVEGCSSTVSTKRENGVTVKAPVAPAKLFPSQVQSASIFPPGFHAPLVSTALGKTFAASQVVQLLDTNSCVYSANIVGLTTNKQGETVVYNYTPPAHLIESRLQPDYGYCVIRYVDALQYGYRVTIEYKPYAGYDGSNQHFILWGSPDLRNWIELDCTDSTSNHIELFDRSNHAQEPVMYYEVTKE